MTPAAATTVQSVLEDAVERLREAGVPDPRREASSLMALVLRTDRGGVAARKPDALPAEAAARFADLLASRVGRTPLQYLEGTVEFCGLTLAVGPGVLIPRPETEDLVAAVLEAGLPDAARVADLGTGSGCIAVALAVRRPSWTMTAIDVAPEALAIASGNADRHGVAGRIEFLHADFSSPAPSRSGAFDAVVSNPPYVSEAEWNALQPEVRDHEPRGALVPGPVGDEAYEHLVPAASSMLAAGGLLALELGWKSEPRVRELAGRHGFAKIAVRPDLQGIARVLTARRQ